MSDFLSNPANAQDDRPEISALAGAVVSMMRDTSQRKAERRLSEQSLWLAERTRAPGPFSSERCVAELLAVGLSATDIVDHCIPAAARDLGQLWCTDQLGFAEVTIASARLQGLLSLLAPPWATAPSDEEEPAIVLVIPAGDTHTLGPHVVTAQFRRRNASVRLIFGPSASSLTRVLKDDPYDGVMFSCSRRSNLESIAEMITRIRSSLIPPPPIIIGGLVLELEEAQTRQAGADIVTNDAQVALEYCRTRMMRHATGNR